MGTKGMQKRKPVHKKSTSNWQNDSERSQEAVKIIGSCMDLLS